MIKVAAWNVRGLNGTDHQRAVEHLVREHHIQFLGLIETRVSYANVFEFGKISCAIGLGLMIIRALRGVFGWRGLVGILRRTLWNTLQSVAADADEPWLVLGDFNAVIDDSEVCGHAADTSASMNEFRQCILDSGLIHLPFTGCPFTWHNCSTGSRSFGNA
ncbi:UNVERIFIED_CONTAM: hypothetical protein Sradi_2477900 [Sesamum radiatum]|uniref:Endonuclease/exonuclease/phosphatase domain-containing protein n=1 Tax=Sesamum radiatum TaxID=300843 RepID=A0AAW2SLE9_SESRA